MRDFIEIAAVTILIIACIYLGSAFIAWDLNPANWSMLQRMLTIIFGPMLIAFYFGCSLMASIGASLSDDEAR